MTVPNAGFAATGLASDPPAALALARFGEELGYSSYWVTETTGIEALSFLGAAGVAAPSMGLGTCVMALQLRTPMIVAMAGATLQTLHPDREIVLGVGISAPVVTRDWHGVEYGERPLARVREYVTLVKACLTGERVDFAGDFYNVKGFRLGVPVGERQPKVVVAALNPGMLKLAGEVADGVLLNYLPASHVPSAIERVRAGGNAKIYGCIHAGVVDRDAYVDRARYGLFGKVVVDSYAAQFERAGFADDVAEVRERHAAGDRAGALAAVSDRFVDAIEIMGDESRVRAGFEAYVDAGVDVPVLFPLPWGEDPERVVRQTMRAVMGRS